METKESKIKIFFRKWFFVFLFPLFFIPFFFISYAYYSSSSEVTAGMKVATWSFQLNHSEESHLGIELASTITDNPYSMSQVIPGTRGTITLELDFSGSKVAGDYVISLDEAETNLPANLKLYTNQSKQEVFNGYIGSVLLEDIDTPVIRKIYWEWEYTEDDETEEWSGKPLSLMLKASVLQKVT